MLISDVFVGSELEITYKDLNLFFDIFSLIYDIVEFLISYFTSSFAMEMCNGEKRVVGLNSCFRISNIRCYDLYLKIFNVRNSEDNLIFMIMNFLGNHCCSYNKNLLRTH